MAQGYNDYGDWGYIPDELPAAPVDPRDTLFNPVVQSALDSAAHVVSPAPTPAPPAGHYEYSDWTGDNVWVEDPPAAKTAPVVSGGLPALAAAQPAPVAAAPIAAPVIVPAPAAPAAFDPKADLDATTLAALQAAYKTHGVGSMVDYGGYDNAGQAEYVPTTANGFQIERASSFDKNAPSGAEELSPAQIAAANSVGGYSKQVGDNVYIYNTNGNLTSVIPTGGRWGGALDIIKFLGPAILSGGAAGFGGAAGIGSSLGLGTGTLATIGGGAALGAGSAALTGGNILKGAFLGGLGGASNIGIGDTGITVGQVNSGLNVVKSLQNGNLFGAITGAANIAGAGNTQIGETGLTINDLSKDLNLAKAVISGNPQALIGALTSVVNSSTNSSNDANNLINQYTQTGAGTGAATPDYPTNDLGFQQILGEFSNPKDLSGNASVNVASNDNASALAALEDAKTAAKIDSGQIIDLGEVSNKPPDAELPPGLNFPGDQSTPTEAQQQQAISNFHDALAETQQLETPAETPVTNPDNLIGQLQDAGLTNDFISRNTPITGDPIDQIVNPIDQIGNPTDQIGNPPPISAEERALLAPQASVTSPDPVQDLLDQATPSDQPAIDQQTKDLLSLLSGGTDNGVTSDDVSKPVFKAEPDAAGTDAEFYKMIGIDPNTIDINPDTLEPYVKAPSNTEDSDLAINRANKIDQSNQQGNEWDNASTGDDLFTTKPPPEETPIDQIDITGKRPTDDSEPGWEGWTPPPTPIDYSGISDMLTGGQNETPPTEQAPAVSIPKIPVTPATKTPAVAPVKTVAPVTKPAAVAQATALVSAIAQGYMPSVGDVAHIKSLESLFGPLLGTLPAEPAHEKKDDSLSALEGMDQEYASGGHVDDFSVEALLHILRS